MLLWQYHFLGIRSFLGQNTTKVVVEKRGVHSNFVLMFLKLFLATTTLFFSLLQLDEKQVESKETGIVLDSLNNSIQLTHDQMGTPAFYFSEVFTPVCNNSDCLPIRINLRWNLDGDFHSYQLPQNEILTKTEHAPFTDFDYAHLDEILRDTLSALHEHSVKTLEREHEKESESVDGVSGATSMLPTGSYVPQAIFTSVRLWHLVHDVKPQLISYTQDQLLLKYSADQFIFREDVPASILALHFLLKSEENPLQKMKDILPKLPESILLKLMPYLSSKGMTDAELATKFIGRYEKGSADIRESIETFWKGLDDSFVLKQNLLQKSLENQEFFGITYQLLEQDKLWEEKLYHQVIDFCETERNLSRRAKMKKLLLSRSSSYPKSVKKRIKKLNW